MKALHFNGVSPDRLWPTPYCSITAVTPQPRVEVGVAVRDGIKVSVVITAIITEAIRNPQARRQSEPKLLLRAGKRSLNLLWVKFVVFIKVICRMWKWSLIVGVLANRRSMSLDTLSGAMRGARAK